MEQQFFKWENWDDIDTATFQFYDCVFIKDFGPFKAGQKCSSIVVDYQNGTLIEYGAEGQGLRAVDLTLAVKE